MDRDEALKNVNPDLGYSALCNYTIQKKIGKGQFSEVYKALYLLKNQYVALKKVKVRLIIVSVIL